MRGAPPPGRPKAAQSNSEAGVAREPQSPPSRGRGLGERLSFATAAATYHSAAVLAREVGARMAQRLDLVKIAPQRVADIGCATGDGIRELQRRYPKAQPLALDFALPMLRAVRRATPRLQRLMGRGPRLINADVRALPLAAGSVGLVWSNLMLHWLDDPLPAFREIYRALDVGGLLMFSTFGPDTLKELRTSFSDGYAHTQRFADMHDYGDMLLECGYSDPVMDVEALTMTYASLDDLFRDLRQSGAACAMQARRRGLMGRSAWNAVRTGYERHRSEGRLPATFEVVYGHAWKTQAKKLGDGSAIVRFDPKQRLR